uniref:Malate dehydrogenase n=1 Tax=Dicyema japonicum TaxID=399803 RepID=B9ZYX0_DICJA|nr:malate dehydrogenase [Dicyema japonicum]
MRKVLKLLNSSFKVAVIGAHGGVGQSTSLLLKCNCNLISKLNLLDIVDPKGIALDLSHIPNKCKVRGFVVPDEVEEGLTGVDFVLFCLENGKITGHTRSSLFYGNAPLVEEHMNSIAKYCPSAMVAFITNPVNSLAPLAVQALANNGVDGSRRVVGVTTLDLIRTISFVSDMLDIEPSEVTSTVLGGHSGETITAIIRDGNFNESETADLCEKISDAGFDVYRARNNVSSTLGIAAAGFRITQSILSGLNGDPNVVDTAFVKSNLTRTSYFSSPVRFGKEGVEEIFPLPKFTKSQEEMLEKSFQYIEQEIQTGLDYFSKS